MRIRVALDQQDEKSIVELNGAICLLGREGCELNLSDKYCSQRHALIYQGNRQELRVRDLKSRNGTFLDGERVFDAEIKVGGRLRIGKTYFEVLEFTPHPVAVSTELAAAPTDCGVEEKPSLQLVLGYS